MAIHVTVALTETAADLITGYGVGAKVYLDSATSEGGSYSNVTSTTLVAGTEAYEFWDAAGTSTTWYKSRPGASGGAPFGAYSDPFQATSLASYASLMDLRESLHLPDTRDDNYLLDLLVDAREMTDADCGRTFLRVPQVSGTSTFFVDVVRSGQQSLVFASGSGFTTDGRALDIISITTLRIRWSESDAYTAVTLGDTGYYLQPGFGPGVAGTEWPYSDIVLAPIGATFTTWPTGFRAVEVVGALGFPKVPRKVRLANVDKARELYRQGPGGGAPAVGVNQFGVPVLDNIAGSYRSLVMPGSPYVRRMYGSI